MIIRLLPVGRVWHAKDGAWTGRLKAADTFQKQLQGLTALVLDLDGFTEGPINMIL